jgi:hypothetical protein
MIRERQPGRRKEQEANIAQQQRSEQRVSTVSGYDPIGVILGIFVAAVMVSVMAEPLNPITNVDLTMWAKLLWGLGIVGTAAIIFVTVRGLAAGGGR